MAQKNQQIWNHCVHVKRSEIQWDKEKWGGDCTKEVQWCYLEVDSQGQAHLPTPGSKITALLTIDVFRKTAGSVSHHEDNSWKRHSSGRSCRKSPRIFLQDKMPTKEGCNLMLRAAVNHTLAAWIHRWKGKVSNINAEFIWETTWPTEAHWGGTELGRPGHASCAVSYQSFFYTLAIYYSDRAVASSFQSTSIKVFYICHAHWHTDVDGKVIFCTDRGPTAGTGLRL